MLSNAKKNHSHFRGSFQKIVKLESFFDDNWYSWFCRCCRNPAFCHSGGGNSVDTERNIDGNENQKRKSKNKIASIGVTASILAVHVLVKMNERSLLFTCRCNGLGAYFGEAGKDFEAIFM